MNAREALDISKYLVVGPENTCGRPVEKIVQQAVQAGFTCVQIRSKVASARKLINLCKIVASTLDNLGKSNEVVLLVNDRLDVILAAREAGIKVDGIHVGQTDIPVEVCRRFLGEDSVVGLSARTDELIEYIKTADVSAIDYFGAGPLHETATKPDCGLDSSGKVVTRSLEELTQLHAISRVPVVVGGGVKVADLRGLKATGVEGFFVVSAIAGAPNPLVAAQELAQAWEQA